MVLSDLIAALQARWKQQLAVLLLVLGLVAVWTALSTKQYTGIATLLFDDQATDPTDALANTGRPFDMAQMINTQADIIKSDGVARSVIETERLEPQAEALFGRQPANTDRMAWMVASLLKNLTVEPGRSSNTLSINYESPDPVMAARIANAFATAYSGAQLALRVDPAKTYTKWFEDRTRDVRDKLEAAQTALGAFQQAHGFTDEGTMAGDSSRLSELSGQLAQAEANAADVRSRAGTQAAYSSDVQQTQVIQQLRAAVSGQTAKIADMATTLGPRHPQYVAAESELAALRARLAEETRQAQASLNVERAAAERRRAELQGLVDAQRGRMVQQATARNQMLVLQRDVESARTAYDNVTQRLSAMRLQSELPRTNVRQLDRAPVPLVPTSPNVRLRLLLGLVFGLIVAVALAGWLEWMRPRTRSADGIRDATGANMVETVDFRDSTIMPMLRRAA